MRDDEAEATAALPHEHMCFEYYAERLVEAGRSETGEMDEILANGASVMTQFHIEMAAGTAECECEAPRRAAELAEDERLGR